MLTLSNHAAGPCSKFYCTDEGNSGAKLRISTTHIQIQYTYVRNNASPTPLPIYVRNETRKNKGY